MNFVNIELTSSFSIRSSMLENVPGACSPSPSSSSSCDDSLLWVSNARLGASDVKELLGLLVVTSHEATRMLTYFVLILKNVGEHYSYLGKNLREFPNYGWITPIDTKLVCQTHRTHAREKLKTGLHTLSPYM